MNWELWGFIAGALTLSGFIPQIIKGFQTKSLKDLSYGLNIFMGVGMFMWLIYGIQIQSISVIVSNAIAVGLNILLISMKYIYSKKDKK